MVEGHGKDETITYPLAYHDDSMIAVWVLHLLEILVVCFI